MDNEEVNPKFVAYTNMEPELRISEVYGTIPSKKQRIAARRGRIRGRLACAQEAYAKRSPASADMFRCVQQVNRDNK